MKDYEMYMSKEIQRMENMVERNWSAVILSVNRLAVDEIGNIRLKYDAQDRKLEESSFRVVRPCRCLCHCQPIGEDA